MLGLLDTNFSHELSIWEVPNDNLNERMNPQGDNDYWILGHSRV